jgi:hypothetical protein
MAPSTDGGLSRVVGGFRSGFLRVVAGVDGLKTADPGLRCEPRVRLYCVGLATRLVGLSAAGGGLAEPGERVQVAHERVPADVG